MERNGDRSRPFDRIQRHHPASASPRATQFNLGEMLQARDQRSCIIANNRWTGAVSTSPPSSSGCCFRIAGVSALFKKTGIYQINHHGGEAGVSSNVSGSLNLYSAFLNAMDQVRKARLARTVLRHGPRRPDIRRVIAKTNALWAQGGASVMKRSRSMSRAGALRAPRGAGGNFRPQHLGPLAGTKI
jgi:hypothetical protein